jgi:hypothetical protein
MSEMLSCPDSPVWQLCCSKLRSSRIRLPDMEQDPRFLQNQSRRLHALYRQIGRLVNIFTTLWLVTFLSLSAAGAVDRIGAFRWGYADDLSTYLLFALFAVGLWVFVRLILKLNLAYIHHTYGPEPVD